MSIKDRQEAWAFLQKLPQDVPIEKLCDADQGRDGNDTYEAVEWLCEAPDYFSQAVERMTVAQFLQSLD